jgi:dipeptidyl aminopeptidase/acylaminoacyl peptidase
MNKSMMATMAVVFLASLAVLGGCAPDDAAPGASAGSPPTPGPQDIPAPVPGDVTLAGDSRPDITRFLNVRTVSAPSLSPDGRQVAFVTQISGEPQLWVVDARSGWPRQLTFGEPITFHRWSPAGDRILYGQDRGGDEREGYYLVSPDGLRERELLPPDDAYRVLGDFTTDGRRIAYASTARTGIDFDLHVLELETGSDRLVFEGRMGLYADSFRPDGGAVLLTEARSEDANDVFLLDTASGALETLFSPLDRAFYGSFAWLPDGSGFYLVTNQDREFRALAFFDLREHTLDFVETPDHDVEQAALSADGRFLIWTTNEGHGFGLHARDLATGERIASPALPRGIYGVQWAAAAPVAAVSVASPSIPGDVWTWNVETNDLWRATHSDGAGLDLSRMVTPEHHSFESLDGLTIHGLLYLPPDLAPGERPPVLLGVHGGPTAQALPTFNAAHQYLLTRGIAVFDLNYRGSTGCGRSFARLNDGRLRENELLDLRAAVEWLVAHPRVDGTRVAIMDGSYGGYLTMAGLTRLPDFFRSGVAFVGVSDWITALEGASPQLQASDRIEYGDINDPDDREFFAALSPLTHVQSIRAPVMVLHGANDPRDPVEESDQFVCAIREQGGEVQYLRFPDEGHAIRRLESQIIAYRRIAAFLEETLAANHGDGGATDA